MDDHPMVVEGMTSMLQQEPSIEVAGYAMNAASCLGFFISQSADVVLLDINLPDKSGTLLLRRVSRLGDSGERELVLEESPKTETL